MQLIRPAREADVDELARLAELSGGEITTLSADRRDLAKRVKKSQLALADDVDRPAGEVYVFVLEDLARPGGSRLLGTCSAQSKTGGFDPFYSYELREERYQSEVLGIDKVVASLHLVEDHSGPAELGGLFLHPDARGSGLGRVLSVARLMFMAMRPASFEAHVVAELRGVTESPGESAFWDAIGRHFFEVPFGVADHLSFRQKQIIADLMPEHPIYVEMLPESARRVIGREHPDASGARRVLESEGFAFRNRVDIFDAGPTLEADLADTRAAREMREATVVAADAQPEGPPCWLAATGHDGFRAVALAEASAEEAQVRLAAQARQVLGVASGDRVRLVRARPGC